MSRQIVRELGETLSFSIGTAIPLEENVLIPEPFIYNVWFNMETLARNFFNSITMPESYALNELLEGFVEEVETLESLLLHNGISTFYYRTGSPREIEKNFPWANIKYPKTEKQLDEANFIEKASKLGFGIIPDEKKDQFVSRIKGDLSKEVFLVTHIPLDLMSFYEFKRLYLLESHTGRIRRRFEWNKKLSKNPSYQHLPFNLLTMQVIGDGGSLFFSNKPAMKKEFLDISEKGKWNPTTTELKQRSDINKYGGKFKDTFIHMLRATLR